ncbi:MAG: hypothetical protein R2729_10830 [Bryobacteraceae bacterium]
MTKTKSFTLLFLFAAAAWPRTDRQTCGSYPGRGQEELLLHRQSMRDPAKIAALRAAAKPASRDQGNIVIMDDTGVVTRRNTFNLDRRFVLFQPVNPAISEYSFQSGEGGYDAGIAQAGTPVSGIGDDDARPIDLPFAFRFYGNSYTSAFLNSDGNITFGAADSASADRSIGRMTSGPPRIAPFYADLDPSRSGSIRMNATPDRVTFSWDAVPEYQDFGVGPRNTFQVSLFADGRVLIAWEGISSRDAVVGIAPGSLRGASAILSFSTPSTSTYSGAVIEGFNSTERVDIVLAAQKFFETHDDNYDYIAIYNNIGIPADNGAVAFEVTVRNNRTGIGDPIVDDGFEYGSASRLQAVLNMGPLSQYPVNPNAVVPSRITSRDTPLTVLGHEAGHLWLAFVSVPDPDNPSATPMLGRQTAHWAFTFNSEASLLEGNRIRDNGAGASPRFTTTATVEGYAPLDQYLMGFRDPRDVPSSFYVARASVGSANRSPQAGVSFDGERRDVSIDDVVAASGVRRPDFTVSQRRFRMAIVLVAREGSQPTAEEMAQIEGYRAGFDPFFARASGDRASMDTSLLRGLRLSVAPASGIAIGTAAAAFVELAADAESPLTVTLRTTGLVTAPASVTIPAGERRASFELRGVSAGVDDLEASPADTRYASAHARIQGNAATALRLEVTSGDKQQIPQSGTLAPIVVRVADANNLPYPGVEIVATPAAGASVQAVRVTTGQDGAASFVWTPGSTNELRLSLAAAPNVVVTATALGKPTIAANGVVNAASFTPGLAPGGIASIFGSSLAGGSRATTGFPLGDELAGVRVLVNGVRAIPIYVSDGQINFIAPAALEPGEAEVAVVTVAPAATGTSNTVRATVRALDPGIFGILRAGTTQLAGTNPSAPGEVIEIYATGMGAVSGEATVTPAQVRIGGSAAQVLYSGPAPGFPGLYQVNAVVPAGVASGQVDAVLVQGQTVSNASPVQIR